MTRWTSLALLAWMAPAAASAHSRLVEPPSRSDEDFLMEGPCGGVPRGESTRLEAGSTVALRWVATQTHFNVYRVAFSPAGDQGFEDGVLGSRPDDAGVLEYEQPVPLPMCICADCTLQLAQFTATGNEAYYSCADIELVAPAGDDLPQCASVGGTTSGGDASSTTSAAAATDDPTTTGALDSTSAQSDSSGTDPSEREASGCSAGRPGPSMLPLLLLLLGGPWRRNSRRSTPGLPVLLVVAGCGPSVDEAPSASPPISTTSLPSSSSTSPQTATSSATSSSSSSSSSSSDAGSSGASAPLECPLFEAAIDAGALDDAELDEASGLTVSRGQPGVMWAHNDSGDSARLFALRDDGTSIGTVALEGIAAVDWEDLALGPGPERGVDYLYIADIGDNLEARASVEILRVPEPAVDGTSIESARAVDVLRFVYADRPHDAETVLSDPRTGDLYVVTKEREGPSLVFRYPFPQATASTTTLESVASIPFGDPSLPGVVLTTAGDVSSDGSLVVVRTYTHAFAWRRAPGMALHDAFETEPCPLPLRLQQQGETLALSADADAYFTVSEGAGSTMWRYDRAD